MDRIDSLEGLPSIGGALLRCCFQFGDAAGRNTKRSARRNAGQNARARPWSRRAAPVVTRGAARSGAGCPPCCLGAVLESVNAARSACAIHVPQWPPSNAGVLQPRNVHAATMAAPVERPTAPRLPGLRACSGAKRRDCRKLPGPAWIRWNLPELAQCSSTALLGGMSHAPPASRQRMRRAPTPFTCRGHARTCLNVATPVQRFPARTVALLLLGQMRDTLSRAFRHDGCPQYVELLDVDSTRSAAFPLRPRTRWDPRLASNFVVPLASPHGAARHGDRHAASGTRQLGAFHPCRLNMRHSIVNAGQRQQPSRRCRRGDQP